MYALVVEAVEEVFLWCLLLGLGLREGDGEAEPVVVVLASESCCVCFD